MFEVEYGNIIASIEFIPGFAAGVAKHEPSSWLILKRETHEDRNIYRVLAQGYSRSPGEKCFKESKLSSSKDDGTYLVLLPGTRRSVRFLSAFPIGSMVLTKMRVRDGVTVLSKS